MTRTKRILTTLAIAAAAAGTAASPALADGHVPGPPKGGPAISAQDGHTPTTPMGDGHIPAPPQG
ncbi:hypothetical protein CP970_24755 [Streptomyces kanamyceticus]|uniref:Tat pathway signal sequence domain protein n=1 Tax=Streptomyces kanamyceticus TaxID=1967 RepID=A0A5J6GF04_STRKN|nr:hypothetical protein [Streptomyces kanamyceticus]QEU93693.1 hypothetical protein CP970_24755 [Streptomyces kanamyceticus]